MFRHKVLSMTCAVMVFAACSSDKPSSSQGSTTTAGATTSTGKPTTTTLARPDGPVADVATEIKGSNPPFIGASNTTALASLRYEEHEYVAKGTATSYKSVGELTADGRWTFAPDDTADYRTRILVRLPEDASKASGRVLVEWLNVSGGIDANPDWASAYEEITRRGDIWVGVSAQLIGVSGGPTIVEVPIGAAIAGKGLVKIDPERYASLKHPGDGYSFDMFTQVARAVRAGGPVIDGVNVSKVIALGESQSAFALTTYINGVQPLTRAFDGFFVHSRGATSLPLVAPGEFADIAKGFASVPALLRDDNDTPILELQTESDVSGILASGKVRQDDTDRFRLWEVAGTAHADKHLMGAAADGVDCGAEVNDGPMHVVTKAALRALVEWIESGEAPPIAPRLVTPPGDVTKVVADADGVVKGGIRTPPVDVPAAIVSGESGPKKSTICILLGSTKRRTVSELTAIYTSRDNYEAKFAAALDEAVKAGYVLDEDREAMNAYKSWPAS